MNLSRGKAKENLAKLIQKFERELNSGKINDYNEEATKTAFIQPFLRNVLGWNVSDRDEVSPEERVSHGRVDYGLKIDGQIKIFIEVKPPKADLKKHIEQAVGYGYNRKSVPFVLLTDFEGIKLFDVTIKPDARNSLKGLKIDLDWKEYLDKFDEIWKLSKESVLKGVLDKELLKKPKDRLPVDKAILDDLRIWRERLAKDIFKNNTKLFHSEDREKDADYLKEITQRIIDRIMFMRSCEDRKLIHRRSLKELFEERTETVGLNTMVFLEEEFKRYNDIFDSDLFRPQEWEKDLMIDFKVMQDIILETYNPYQFDVIPLEVLGNMYEQYLGYTIRLTDHQVKYELKPEVRKAGGVYYTPEYIVDYIVKNTVGKLLKELPASRFLSFRSRTRFGEGISSKTKKFRILDPACGSGSFLIRAYEEMLNYYKNQKKRTNRSRHSSPLKGEDKGGGESFSKSTVGVYSQQLIKHEEQEPTLTIEEKSKILQEHIFGVDIDEQAVEVTKLSLMLKMLEGEFGIIPGRNILPMLDRNIRCGNSLISGDTLELKKYFGDDWYKVKAFNWKDEFRKIMVDEGGFDVVIGNPPYGAELTLNQRKYLEDKYSLHNTDTACLFMGLAVNLLKIRGLSSYIVPKPFTYASNWQHLRQHIYGGLLELADCGKVWKEVKLEQTVYLFGRSRKSDMYKSCIREGQKIVYLGDISKKTFMEFGFYLNGISSNELSIGQKIRNTGVFFNNYIINQRGAIYQKYIIETPSDYKVIGGKQIGRYYINEDVKGYINRNLVHDEKAFIKKHSIMVQRIVAHITKPIDHIKITAALSDTLDINNYIIVDTINQLQNKSSLDSRFFLAILNSKLISWYAYRFIFGKAIRTMQFDNPVTARIPIPRIDLKKGKSKYCYNSIITLVDVMFDLNKKVTTAKGSGKEQIQRQIEKTDSEIDDLVFKLYGITDEEISVPVKYAPLLNMFHIERGRSHFTG